MQYDFAIPANGAQVLDVVGRFVKYVGGTGKIRVRMDKGGYIDLLPGQGAKGLDFARIQIEDRSGAGNVGILLAGNFEFQDDRISGTVDVIDGGRTRTLGGLAFLAYSGAAALASNYPVVQLFNPVGSGRNMFVEGFAAQTSGTGAQGMALRTITAEIGGLAGYTGGTSKKVGAAVSTSRMSNGNIPTFTGFTVMNLDKSKRDFQFKEPIMCAPGTGVFVFNVSAGEDLGASFEYFEEAL